MPKRSYIRLNPPSTYISWNETSVTVPVGGTVTVTHSGQYTVLVNSYVDGYLNGLATADAETYGSATFTGVSAGTVTIPYDAFVGSGVYTSNTLTITVTAPVDDTEFLNKRGLTHFWENIDDIKQNKLTAGAGISITGNTISATGGGTADAVDWGHITGSMSNQTDLTTALAAKANSADLATVATSGSYNDLSNKPTIPTVNNATLTIQKNGTTVKTFTANASSNVTANITVPTKTSDLTNDSGFITSETEEIFYIGITSVDDVNGTFTADKTFEEILAAINAGQLPVVYDRTTKTSFEQTDYVPLSYYYVDDDASEDYISFMRSSINTVNGNNVVAGLGGGVLYFDFQRDRSGGTPVYNYYYENKESSISSVSSVSSSSTNRQVPGAKLFYDTMATKADTSSLATVATSGSYNDLSNKPAIPTVNNATLTIQKNGTTVKTFTANQSTNATANITVPTKTSDLNNDSGFITSADTGWVYLGEQRLTSVAAEITFTLPAQYDNYKVVFYGAMASTASDGCWIDFIMLNGTTGINVVHQVQLVAGTTWSSAFNGGTFAMNIQSNPYAGLLFKFESWRAGPNDWRHYTGSMASNSGSSATTRTSIVNGRATSSTQPTAFAVKTYGTGNVFNTGASMRVWASNH